MCSRPPQDSLGEQSRVARHGWQAAVGGGQGVEDRAAVDFYVDHGVLYYLCRE